ncbi:MAG: hypothetical protein IKS51_07950 [Erysipelotrichaceae bacterium]|nr:hypothetical protein [Erysipelotrichaceae bacterium]
MKKIIVLFCLLLCLAACTKKEPGEEIRPEPTDLEPDPVVIVPDSAGKPLTEAYVSSMEEYEIMEIVLLGKLTSDTFDQAVAWGYDFVNEIKDDRVILGNVLSVSQPLAYLIIPKEGTTLTIGSYDSLSNSISDICFEEKNALPVIYCESVTSMTPPGMITLKNGDLTMRMMTGLNAQGQLRTEYLMGIVDNTPYDKLQGIVPYGEKLKEILENEAPVASDDIRNNDYMAMVMDEMIYKGEMYLVYSVENYSGLPPYLYGIHYDQTTNELKYIISYDHEVWMDPNKIEG